MLGHCSVLSGLLVSANNNCLEFLLSILCCLSQSDIAAVAVCKSIHAKQFTKVRNILQDKFERQEPRMQQNTKQIVYLYICCDTLQLLFLYRDNSTILKLMLDCLKCWSRNSSLVDLLCSADVIAVLLILSSYENFSHHFSATDSKLSIQLSLFNCFQLIAFHGKPEVVEAIVQGIGVNKHRKKSITLYVIDEC